MEHNKERVEALVSLYLYRHVFKEQEAHEALDFKSYYDEARTRLAPTDSHIKYSHPPILLLTNFCVESILFEDL